MSLPCLAVLKVIGVAAVGATAACMHSGAIGGNCGAQSGSIAAGIQAGIGDVAAGSLFATAQSIAMPGALSGVVTAVSTAIGGICAAAGRSSEFNRLSSCAFPAIKAYATNYKYPKCWYCHPNTLKMQRGYGSIQHFFLSLNIQFCNGPGTSYSILPHPVVLAAGALAGLFLLPLATKIVLGLIGFSAIGPVAGSIAAGIQAAIGNVAAGSLFATLQSIAMGGALHGVLAAIGGFIGGIMGALFN
ncbi:hypothetical protein EDB85DRAFT_1889048 [Lactarius pseudohatsudake]|nr:hypothetical protein EDB85DRAFT_1889048 [Lactarius pseudohatsudake]